MSINGADDYKVLMDSAVPASNEKHWQEQLDVLGVSQQPERQSYPNCVTTALPIRRCCCYHDEWIQLVAPQVVHYSCSEKSDRHWKWIESTQLKAMWKAICNYLREHLMALRVRWLRFLDGQFMRFLESWIR